VNSRDPAATALFREAAEAPRVVRDLLERNRESVAAIAARLRSTPPRAVVTCARGSSDHAATYAKYLIETRVGVLTASAAPSVVSVYRASQDLRDCLFLAVSQSGASPDVLATAQSARRAGATVVAIVNDESSPLAAAADHCLALHAGREESIAATKTWIASLAALAQLVAAWTRDAALQRALDAAPDLLERAWALRWDEAVERLAPRDHLFTIARGIGLAVAQEAALKCKETCGLHAESFSGAEVRHGPQALLSGGFPALVLAQDDEALASLAALARDLVARKVEVLGAGIEVEGAVALPAIAAHPAIQPLLLAQSFYRFANALALARGLDPDRPPHLRKITRTT
jgi:glucosamine--fructose-6-phosphate aminotransferase (isomerizing)